MAKQTRWLLAILLLIPLLVYRIDFGNTVLDTLDVELTASLQDYFVKFVWIVPAAVILFFFVFVYDLVNGKRIAWVVLLIALSIVLRLPLGKGIAGLVDLDFESLWVERILTFILSAGTIFSLTAIIVYSLRLLLDTSASRAVAEKDYRDVLRLAAFSSAIMPVGEDVLEAYRLLALVMLGRFEDVEGSLTRLKNASQTHRIRTLVQLSQWRMHNALGNTQVALDHYRRLMKIIKFSQAPQAEAIEALIELGKPTEALTACKNLYKTDNSLATLAEAEALAAWAYAAIGEREKMRNLIDSALSRLEKSPADTASDVHYRVGKAFEIVYSYQPAEKHYNLSHDSQPDGIRGIRAESALRHLASMPRYEAMQKP
jgi:tetratricopeptide (TPR) repeat protein